MIESVPQVLRNNLILQVGLTIEILSFDIANALIFSAFDDNHISWEKFILMHFNEITDFNLLPTNLLKVSNTSVESIAKGIILEGVLAMSRVIFVRIFHHRGENDEDKGRQHCWLAIRN